MEGCEKVGVYIFEHGCMDENNKNIEKLLHKSKKEDIIYL